MKNVSRYFRAALSGSLKGHFGQWAEDVLVRKLFPRNKNDGTYLDLGAYHPFTHSNTAYLWSKGWNGINVDANPASIKLFEKMRPDDINVWVALIPELDYASGRREVELLLPSSTDHNSEVVARGTISASIGEKHKFIKTLKVPASSIGELLRGLKVGRIDYLNIDIEGYDEMILGEINLSQLSPTVVSVEDFSENLLAATSSNIAEFMFKQQYSLVGRAGPTSIFLQDSR